MESPPLAAGQSSQLCRHGFETCNLCNWFRGRSTEYWHSRTSTTVLDTLEALRTHQRQYMHDMQASRNQTTAAMANAIGAYANVLRAEYDQDTLLIAKDFGHYGQRFLADDKMCRAA